MTNLDNNFNVNNKRAYTPKLEKNDRANKSDVKTSNNTLEGLDDGIKAADAYGRILVKSDKIDSSTPITAIVEDLDFLLDNYDLTLAAMNTVDDAYDLLLAQESENAYEKACCGAIDATLERKKHI